MITVHCISLADQHDRRDYMRRQLDACGLPYRFFDALRVNLADGWPAIYQRQRRMNHSGVDMRAGEMGCYLSHRQVWSDFLAGDDEVCLVMEDDVEIHPGFAEVVKSLVEARQHWEFVRLFGVFRREVFPVRRLAGGHCLVDYLEQPNGTQGYLINRQAAQRLMVHTGSMWHAIDMAIDRDWEHGVRIMGIEPSVISHQEAFETTLGTWHKLRLPLHKKILREYHRAGSNLRKRVWLLQKRMRLRVHQATGFATDE
ncbi:MAG: glycosyltransferase family 25 protein [Pseudomonadota bacterium]